MSRILFPGNNQNDQDDRHFFSLSSSSFLDTLDIICHLPSSSPSLFRPCLTCILLPRFVVALSLLSHTPSLFSWVSHPPDTLPLPYLLSLSLLSLLFMSSLPLLSPLFTPTSYQHTLLPVSPHSLHNANTHSCCLSQTAKATFDNSCVNFDDFPH